MEQNSKPDVVKAFIDLKKGVLQLEGSQEFVEKYLDPIIKNCKPFSPPSPKPTKEQELRKLEKSTAYTHFRLALGLFSAALLVYNVQKDSGWKSLVFIGVIFMLSSFYFFAIHKWNRQKITNVASAIRTGDVLLFLTLVSFGTGLIQAIRLDWAAIIGRVLIYAGYAVLIIGWLYQVIDQVIEELKLKKPQNV